MKIHDSSFSTDFSERHKMIMSGWMLAPLMGRSKRCVDQGKHGHGGFRFAIGPAPSHHPIIHPATGTLGVPPWRRGNQVDPVNVFVGFPPQKIATRTSCCASSFWSMAKWNSRPGAMQLWLGRFPDSLDQNFEPRLVSGCLPQAEDVFFWLPTHSENAWVSWEKRLNLRMKPEEMQLIQYGSKFPMLNTDQVGLQSWPIPILLCEFSGWTWWNTQFFPLSNQTWQWTMSHLVRGFSQVSPP